MQDAVRRLVADAGSRGGLPLDDVLALTLPLLEAVAEIHDRGLVAPLRGLDALDVLDHRLVLHHDHGHARRPRLHPRAVADAERELRAAALDVTRAADRHHDLRSGRPETTSVVDVDPASPAGLRIVAGWQRWEHLLDHHDELTDIGSLGELAVALLAGLDLATHQDAADLATHRSNLFALVPRLDPVVAAILTAMIQPDRRRRPADLPDLVTRLRTYRDQPEDFDLDRVLAGDASGPPRERRELVLSHLRERLFDLSRRNPLLHFRPSARTLDLTQASVPLVLDVRSIRPESLFTWGGPTSRRLGAGGTVDVGSVVRWEEAPYAESSLDTIAATARRDRSEFGQDQLRLVVAFLRWHDVHDDPATTITSPLVLARAEITKRRGVRHSHRLRLRDAAAAEVNPVLRHQLRELYGFVLPETVDLSDPTAIEALREDVERQGRATQAGLSIALVEHPRIELIRSRAETALTSYRRRRQGTRPVIGRRHYPYSYTRPDWAPLGVQIYADRVRRQPLEVAVELGDAPHPRATAAPDPGATDTDLFTVGSTATDNPFAWEVDLCSVTLANFSYRTLSLVRDYDALLAEPRPHPAFDELFSAAPRESPATGTPYRLEDRYLVVPADDSQMAAIAQARAADNFVIQGPPGTGKSQTITNLIADYLARDKRVLFVCAKRAALDVVHARLRSRGLDEVCTLVHDSQQDKKTFVHGMRDTYESWSNPTSGDSLAEVEARRRRLVDELTAITDELGALDDALLSGDPRTLEVLDALVDLRDHRWGTDLAPDEVLLLPSLRTWAAARAEVDRLMDGLPGPLATTPLALVAVEALGRPRPDAEVAAVAGRVATALESLVRSLHESGGPGLDESVARLTLTDVEAVARLHALLDPLARRGRLGALQSRSATATDLAAASEAQARLVAASTAATEAAGAWSERPVPDEARHALDVARAKESAPFRFFSGEWRRVRRLVEESYVVPAATSMPAASAALSLLVAADDADRALAESRERARTEWGHGDLVTLVVALDDLRGRTDHLAGWRDRLAADDDAPRAALDHLAADLHDLRSAGRGVLLLDGHDLSDLTTWTTALGSDAGAALVRSGAPRMVELGASQAQVLDALRRLNATPDQISYAVLAAELATARAGAPALGRVDGPRIAALLDRVAAVEPDLHAVNAEVVVARLRDRFRARSAAAARQATWSEGQRVLEHEFGKVRAYKSIRQLAEGSPGEVTAALRPVWLMSPASLSDTLPLTSSFDVVIYDEASQVPVEEAVPALHRAAQVIVVGDRMQLPPTRYFTAGPANGDDSGGPDELDDEAEARLGVVLDADSFLAVSSTRLPSTMLLWHYRSRFEALIQFSNTVFYDGRLATVPDRTPALRDRRALLVGGGAPDPEVASAVTDEVLTRSISVVRVQDGVYDRRTNAREAAWTAALVRDLVLRRSGLTIGVVAFSEAQQSEIERALERLTEQDREFARAYDDEVAREEDGQGVGLFVKNLENVQGDERDVMVMSVCYAAAPDGRMRMNFGPINTAGGEKRLNVIFSRARRHMVLTSSIDPSAITNVYNPGARTLRDFLAYAEAISVGDDAGAARTLAAWRTDGLGVVRDPAPIVTQMAEVLAARGLDVVTSLGGSDFRCDLAVRAPGAERWTLGVLVDHARRLRTGSTEQRRVVQPGVLRASGWRVEQVTVAEWLAGPDAVVERLAARVHVA
ncbi:AAA domain-containing protein [Nocardioides sp.]|uniref:AAA domain-containing protein n=1 Tax=Nocardioides sp. TaxID=35761 RepID=UPI002611DC20|nr:AAA domain-containing protein [Nocardioides sp.]